MKWRRTTAASNNLASHRRGQTRRYRLQEEATWLNTSKVKLQCSFLPDLWFPDHFEKNWRNTLCQFYRIRKFLPKFTSMQNSCCVFINLKSFCHSPPPLYARFSVSFRYSSCSLMLDTHTAPNYLTISRHGQIRRHMWQGKTTSFTTLGWSYGVSFPPFFRNRITD